jgi:hypothetical protein
MLPEAVALSIFETYEAEVVLDDVSLFLAHENIVKLKININIMYIYLIFFSFSNLHYQHPIKL